VELEFRTDELADVVLASGSIDSLTASQLTQFLLSKIEQGHTCLVLDLKQVDFMSSAGLRTLLSTLKESRSRGCDLRLAGASSELTHMLQISGFTNIIRVFPDLPSALASFAASSD
jgi:anti-sigma B factor antagonist